MDLAGHRGVGEHEGAGERLGEVGFLLQAAGGAGEHVGDALGRGVARVRAPAQGGLGLLELAGERRDQQVDLRGEVAVERAEGDVGLLGDGAHLDGVEAALGGESDGGVQDALAAVALGGGAEVLVGQRAHGGHDLNLPDVISVAAARRLVSGPRGPRLSVRSGIIETRSSSSNGGPTPERHRQGARKGPPCASHSCPIAASRTAAARASTSATSAASWSPSGTRWRCSPASPTPSSTRASA